MKGFFITLIYIVKFNQELSEWFLTEAHCCYTRKIKQDSVSHCNVKLSHYLMIIIT